MDSVAKATGLLKGPNAEMQEFSNEEDAMKWIKQKSPQKDNIFYAIRGGEKDGVVTQMDQVFPRLVGKGVEYDSFMTRREAINWIDALKIFAVKFGDGTTQVVSMQNVMKATKGKRGVQVLGAMSKQRAEEKVRHWTKQRSEQQNASRTSKYDASSSAAERIDLKTIAGCIARMRDGSVCMRTNNLSMTALGPLCGEHVVMCTQPSKTQETTRMHNHARTLNMQTTVQDEQQKVCSPDEGVLLPVMKESLRKDKQGLYAVVAVRTFQDADMAAKPAGSVWLSSDEASKSNKRGEDF